MGTVEMGHEHYELCAWVSFGLVGWPADVDVCTGNRHDCCYFCSFRVDYL